MSDKTSSAVCIHKIILYKFQFSLYIEKAEPWRCRSHLSPSIRLRQISCFKIGKPKWFWERSITIRHFESGSRISGWHSRNSWCLQVNGWFLYWRCYMCWGSVSYLNNWSILSICAAYRTLSSLKLIKSLMWWTALVNTSRTSFKRKA